MAASVSQVYPENRIIVRRLDPAHRRGNDFFIIADVGLFSIDATSHF